MIGSDRVLMLLVLVLCGCADAQMKAEVEHEADLGVAADVGLPAPLDGDAVGPARPGEDLADPWAQRAGDAGAPLIEPAYGDAPSMEAPDVGVEQLDAGRGAPAPDVGAGADRDAAVLPEPRPDAGPFLAAPPVAVGDAAPAPSPDAEVVTAPLPVPDAEADAAPAPVPDAAPPPEPDAALPDRAIVDAAAPDAAVEPPPVCGANLIRNAGFEAAGLRDWTLEVHRAELGDVYDTAGEAAVGERSARIDSFVDDGPDYAVQLNQRGIAAVEGARYQVGFLARSSVPRHARIELSEQDGPLWAPIGLAVAFRLGLDWRAFTFTFRATDTRAARLVFHGGGVASSIWIDEVALCRLE